MKAIRVDEFGGPEVLTPTVVEDPEPAPDQVIVRVHATGVNFADLKARKGASPAGGRALPFVPGLDATGTVVRVGAAVRGLAPGQRVVTFPLAGSYCELAVSTENLTFPIPDAISHETAAAFPVVAGTSYAMLTAVARLRAGESVLVHSAGGGVGTTAVQLARHMKASRVFATVGSDRKKALLETLGVDAVVNYRTEDYAERVRALTGGKGADVILNPLAGDVLEKDLECLAPFGRLVCFGHAGGSPAGISSALLHASCRSVLGFSFGAVRRLRPETVPEIMGAVIAWVADGVIHPVIGRRYALDQAAAAHAFIESRQSTGKVLLTVTPHG